jgi:hypothetical protein
MIEVCPDCGSAKIELEGRILADDQNAVCTSCGWRGKKKDLLTPMRQEADTKAGDVMTPDQALYIAQEVAKDYMVRLAAYAAQPAGLAMVEAGIVGAKDKHRLGRLIKAAMKGAHKATLDEVEAIQKELQQGEENAGN